MELTVEQLTGRTDDHVDFRGGRCGLQTPCWEAFDELQRAAAAAGFDMQIASAFRSFDRQLVIWNEKARGTRPVHDDRGAVVRLEALGAVEKIHVIMRYSALPGASRHHWGTDMDVFDAAAMPAGYELCLSPAEVAADGMFAPFHAWLDERIARGEASGFRRPYAEDRGGVAPERWHLSHAPLSRFCEELLNPALLAELLQNSDMELRDTVLGQLPDIFGRYIRPASTNSA